VLIIVGDDIGYGHVGAFGGPARTQTFDRLAAQGLKYTNFHITAVCSASRACLLTGRNSHSVGMGVIPESSTGFPGYNAMIPRSAATVFEILRQNGYGTAWIGKTHLTPSPEGGLHGTLNKLSYFNGVAESLEDVAGHIDDLGGPRSHGAYPAAWAYATATPFTYGKGVTSGGGCSTTAVVSWPARIKDHGGIRRQFHHHIDITPTILDSAGVPAPIRVNGVDQKPMEGVSMLYTFDDAEAEDRHTTQYFELVGTRAIYHDGWWAGTRHGQDGRAASAGAVPLDQDVWELYDMTTDFGHAIDLAAKHPEKLAELQAIFDREARKYNVYPLADNLLAPLSAERPGLVSGNRASYRPGTVRIPEDAVINIKNRSFTLTAELENPDGNAEGVFVTVGGETGGYALVVQNGKQTFDYNWLGGERYTIASSEKLPAGKCTIRFDFAYDGDGAGKGGTGTLSVNDKQVAEGCIDKTVPVVFSTDDTFDVGADWGTPVSPTYQPPFTFTGVLTKVTVEAK
jgi:hypothetical protein